MKYSLILAAALCLLAKLSFAASLCGEDAITEPQACKVNTGTDSEEMFIVAGLTNVSNGATPQLLAYLQTLRDPRGAAILGSESATLAGLREVRPVRLFDNLVVLNVRTALLRSGDVRYENLSAFLSVYEKELNRKLERLSRVRLPRDQEFRVDAGKITTARLEVSQRLRLNSAPNDLHFPTQWSLREEGINAEAAWSRLAMIPVSQLKPITVAVIDENIDPSNPELKNTDIEAGCDLFTQSQQPFECSPVPRQLPTDAVAGHGTSVIGVLAAATNNGSAGDGVAGVTWRGVGETNLARILPVQMDAGEYSRDEDKTCTHNFLAALRYSVDPENTTKDMAGLEDLWNMTNDGPSGQVRPISPEKGAKVVNMSFGFNDCSEYADKLMDRIARYFPDVLLVNAVGNNEANIDGAGGTEYPAGYPAPGNANFDNLLTVTSSNKDKLIEGNYGNTSVDIAAPGSTDLPYLVTNDSGSSYAAPLVSGVAAVLKSLAPSWGYAKIRKYIMQSRKTHRDTRWSNGGILDMDAATKAPVKFKESEGTGRLYSGTTWYVGNDRRIKWTSTLDSPDDISSLCPELIVEGQYQDNSGTWPMTWELLPLVDTNEEVNTDPVSNTGSVGALVRVPPLDLNSGDMRKARVRLRCNDTQLFTVSQEFKVENN